MPPRQQLQTTPMWLLQFHPGHPPLDRIHRIKHRAGLIISPHVDRVGSYRGIQMFDNVGRDSESFPLAIALNDLNKGDQLKLHHPDAPLPAIFPPQATLFTKLRSPQKLVIQLGRSALNICHLVFHSSYDCWDRSPWIMKLFSGLSSRLSEGTGISYSTTASPIDSTPETGIFNRCLKQFHAIVAVRDATRPLPAAVTRLKFILESNV